MSFLNTLSSFGTSYLQIEAQRDIRRDQAAAQVASAQIAAQANNSQFKTILTVVVIGAVLFAITRK